MHYVVVNICMFHCFAMIRGNFSCYAALTPIIQNFRFVRYYFQAGNKYRVLFEWNYTQPLTFNNQPDVITLRIASDPGQTGNQVTERSYEATFQFDREEPDTVYLEAFNCRGLTRSNSISLLSK